MLIPLRRGPRPVAWILLWLGVCGCGAAPSGLVTVQSRRIHRPILLSEVQASVDPQSLLDTRFEFQNSLNQTALLRFDGAGCSCYQVSSRDRPLKAGDILTIPAMGSLPVNIGVPTPSGAGSPEYNARFSWIREGADPVDLPVSLSLPVFSDLSVVPSVITAGYRPGVAPAPIPVRVTVHSRDAEAAQVAPVVTDLSEMLQLGAWNQVVKEQPAEDLWKAIWQADLQLQVPDGFRQQVATAVTLQAGPTSSLATRLSILIQPLVGIRSSGEMQLGLLKTGEKRRRRMLLTAADKRPFRVTATHCEDPRCRAIALSQELADRHWLEVEAMLTDDNSLDAKVVCSTDHPESPQIVIPVHAENTAHFANPAESHQ
ncbi:MAG: hypothetical protein ACK5Q5_22520 [Planctomycetaceae bacterium]